MLYTPRLLAELALLLRQNLPLWGFAPSSPVHLLHYSENASFIAGAAEYAQNQTDEVCEVCCFRFYRPLYHSNAEISSELAWLERLNHDSALTAKGLRFPVLQPLLNGAPFLSLSADSVNKETKQAESPVWRLACFSYLRGHEPQQGAALIPLYQRLGEMSALLHKQSRLWAKPQGFQRKEWDYAGMAGENAVWGDWRKIPMPAADYAVLARASAALQSRWRALRQTQETLLIHADMRPANLLITAEKGQNFSAPQFPVPKFPAPQFPALLDFDDCGFALPAQDCANALSFMEEDPLKPQLTSAWLSGYQIHADSAAIEAALPVCLMLRRLQLTAWLSTHAETPAARAYGKNFLGGTARLAAAFLALHF